MLPQFEKYFLYISALKDTIWISSDHKKNILNLLSEITSSSAGSSKAETATEPISITTTTSNTPKQVDPNPNSKTPKQVDPNQDELDRTGTFQVTSNIVEKREENGPKVPGNKKLSCCMTSLKMAPDLIDSKSRFLLALESWCLPAVIGGVLISRMMPNGLIIK